jgi:hypothetical protein
MGLDGIMTDRTDTMLEILGRWDIHWELKSEESVMPCF